MPDEFAPETLDTGAISEETGNIETGNLSEETQVAEDTGGEPETNQKLWGGYLKTPEELEQEFMRLGMENNRLKKAMEKPVQKEENTVDPRLEALFHQHYQEISSENQYEDEKTIRNKAIREAKRDFELVLMKDELENTRNEIKKTVDPRFQVIEMLEKDPEFEDFGRLSSRERDILLKAMAVGQRNSNYSNNSQRTPQRQVNSQHLMADKSKSVGSNGSLYGLNAEEIKTLKSRGITSEAGLKAYAKGANKYHG